MKRIIRAYLEKKNKSYLNLNSHFNEDINDNNNKNRSKIFAEKERRDSKVHENNLKIIEKLKNELNDLEKKNNLISNEINLLKKSEKKEKDDYNKINNEINNQKIELNKLKEINDLKNREYIQLRNHHREMIIRDLHNLHNDAINELNRQSLHRFFERLTYLYRLRTENNIGPPITNEQIQALPISYYPHRNNNSNQKCTICGFPYCYNDVIIKLRRCQHIFHKACLINSLNLTRASICPICKTSLI